MKTRLFVLLLAIISFVGCTEKKIPQFPVGTYDRIGTDGSNLGQLLLYQASDSIVLFRLEVTKGAPSYNSGSLAGRIRINTDQFLLTSTDNELNCEIKLTLLEESISLTTLKDDCGFGGNVYADGTFILRSRQQPEFFTTMEGDTVRFEDFKNSDWN